LADLRGMVMQLHPVELVERGLAGAVRDHAESVQGTSGLHVEVDAEDMSGLSTELQEDLYRIVQEALHNVVKHAGATRASVRLHEDGPAGDRQVLLQVCDDGSGLVDLRPRSDALGLVSMRERAQRWGGRMEIGSDERGCKVRVRVPARGGLR
jgi:signal transduction histidine kinase